MGHFLRSCKNSLLIWQKEKLSSFRNWLPIICLCLQQELHRCLSLVLTLFLPSTLYMMSPNQYPVHQHVPTHYICMSTKQQYVIPFTDILSQHWWMVPSSVKSACVISMTMCNSGTLIINVPLMCWYKIFCVERTFITVLWFPCYDNFAKVDSGIDIVDKDFYLSVDVIISSAS